MAGYVIANLGITDPAGYEPCLPAVIPTLHAHGAEVPVADDDSEGVEGRPGKVMIAMRFASNEAARAWYESPEYQRIAHLRTDNTEGMVVFADGFETPEATAGDARGRQG